MHHSTKTKKATNSYFDMMCISGDDNNQVDHIRALMIPTYRIANQHQDNNMIPSASATSVSDLSGEIMSDGVPSFGCRRGGFDEYEFTQIICDDHHPDTDGDDDNDAEEDDDIINSEDDDGHDEDYEGVGDPTEYINRHYRNIAIDTDTVEKIDDKNPLLKDLVRLELRVAELESQLTVQQQAGRDSMHDERTEDVSSIRMLEQHKVSLEQENAILLRKLVGMHEELFAERINSMKAQNLFKAKLSALKSEMDWTNERNDSLLKTNLELKSMLRKSERLKAKRRKTIEGELVCPFPMDGERQLRRMSYGSNASSTIEDSVNSFDFVRELQKAIVQPANVVSKPLPSRRATVQSQSTEEYVPFPKDKRRATVTGPPFSSKRSGLLDAVLSFLPRVVGGSQRGSRDGKNVEWYSANGINTNTDEYPFAEQNVHPSRWQPESSQQYHQHQELERFEPHESWSAADEINVQTELFNFKSLSKIDKSHHTSPGDSTFSIQSDSGVKSNPMW